MARSGAWENNPKSLRRDAWGRRGGDGAVPIQAGHQSPGGAGSAHPSSNPTISGATGMNRRPEPSPAGKDGLPSSQSAGPTPNTPLLHHKHPPAPPPAQKSSSPVILTCPKPVMFTARTQLCLAQLCLPKSCVFRRFHAASPHPKHSTNLQGHTTKTIDRAQQLCQSPATPGASSEDFGLCALGTVGTWRRIRSISQEERFLPHGRH